MQNQFPSPLKQLGCECMHASCQWNVSRFECSLAPPPSSGFKCDQPYSRFSPSSTRDLWPFQACYCTDLRRRFAIPPSRLKALFCLGGRVHERASDSYFLPFSFFCSTGGGLMWPTRRGKSPMLQISYGKDSIKLNLYLPHFMKSLNAF